MPTASYSADGLPGESQLRSPIGIAGTPMNTRNLSKTAVSVLLTIALFTTVTAQAGILDWFKSSGASSDMAANGSFNSLYASVLDNFQPNDEPVLMGNAIVPASSPAGSTQRVLRRTYTVQLSAYNSEVAQTDDSPFITASNTHVRDGVVASNMFPFGTILKIPSLYGNKIFVVEDRMNKRYQKNVDIWFADKDEALKLGRRTVEIVVIQ